MIEKSGIAALALVFSACAGLIVPQPVSNQSLGVAASGGSAGRRSASCVRI